MTSNRYHGSMTTRRGETRDGTAWRAFHGEHELTLHVEGPRWRLFTFDQLALHVRGYVVLRDGERLLEGDVAAEYLREYYERHDDLPIRDLDGSFTVLLADARRGRVLLYRSLPGNGFTYYTETPGGLVFGNNLADLVEACGRTPRPNRAALPAFFLYRFVPGRETLFDGFYRLLPGEMLTYDDAGLLLRQRQTFADMRLPEAVGPDAVDRVERTLGHVVADCAALCPRSANLLSGGVDSTYLQALWNRTGAAAESFAVHVDHERTRADADYAISAATALKVRHRFVPADAPYITYLHDTLGSTGEPPNHVFAAYLGRLARAMRGHGFAAGVCGEGADSLFGNTAIDMMHKAGTLRALLPFDGLRRAACSVSAGLGWRRLHEHLWLARHLHDLNHPAHPANRVAVFADEPAVRACFGEGAVEAALAERRALLDHYRVPETPLDRLHGAGYLGEAADSASLWTALFNHAGADLFSPFLDSRVLRLALNIEPRYRFPYRNPKALLKAALARHVPRVLAYRSKLGFGQPVFEWMAPGGQLRPWVERIGDYDFVDRKARAIALARPNWFLYNLLCYDIWHRLFIDRSLPRTAPEMAPPLHQSAAVGL